MEKMLALMLIIIALFSLTGCGDSKKTADTTTETMTEVVEEAAENIAEAAETEKTETTEKAQPEQVEEAPAEEPEEWRQFLADYEAWVDKYVTFMEKYTENPTDMTLLADYATMASEMVEWSEKAETVQAELEASPEALSEYTETLLRIAGKMASIAY